MAEQAHRNHVIDNLTKKQYTIAENSPNGSCIENNVDYIERCHQVREFDESFKRTCIFYGHQWKSGNCRAEKYQRKCIVKTIDVENIKSTYVYYFKSTSDLPCVGEEIWYGQTNDQLVVR